MYGGVRGTARGRLPLCAATPECLYLLPGWYSAAARTCLHSITRPRHPKSRRDRIAAAPDLFPPCLSAAAAISPPLQFFTVAPVDCSGRRARNLLGHYHNKKKRQANARGISHAALKITLTTRRPIRPLSTDPYNTPLRRLYLLAHKTQPTIAHNFFLLVLRPVR